MIVPGAAGNVVIGGHNLPVPVILIGGCLILFSLFSAISWQDHEQSQTLTRTGHGLSSTDQAGIHQAAASTACQQSAMGSSAAQPLLPFYMECIHSPKFQAGSTGDLCQVLGRPSVDNHTLSWAEYKLLDTLEMDPSRCEAFVQAIAPELKAQAQLQHVSVKLRPQSSDHSVLLQVYCEDHFNYMTTLSDFMPIYKPITFLDGGSNTGMASILFSHAMMGNGEVLAVEAHPDTFETMLMNTINFEGVITPVQAAMVSSKTAAENATLKVQGPKGGYWGFRVKHDHTENSKAVMHEVPTRSLVQLRDMTVAKHFDMIKIDIEGEEKYILEDDESKAVLCEATCIFMELHEHFLAGTDAAFQAFMQGGCEGEQFEEIITTGEYILICKPSKRVIGN